MRAAPASTAASNGLGLQQAWSTHARRDWRSTVATRLRSAALRRRCACCHAEVAADARGRTQRQRVSSSPARRVHAHTHEKLKQRWRLAHAQPRRAPRPTHRAAATHAHRNAAAPSGARVRAERWSVGRSCRAGVKAKIKLRVREFRIASSHLFPSCCKLRASLPQESTRFSTQTHVCPARARSPAGGSCVRTHRVICLHVLCVSCSSLSAQCMYARQLRHALAFFVASTARLHSAL
jgi:hypothetical protein